MINSKKLSLFRDGSSASVGLSDISISRPQDDLFNDFNSSQSFGKFIFGQEKDRVRTFKTRFRVIEISNDGVPIIESYEVPDLTTKDGAVPL